MKSYQKPVAVPRFALEVVQTLPVPIKIGELVYLNAGPKSGMYIYLPDGWLMIRTPSTAVSETFLVTEEREQEFTLATTYVPGTRSLDIFINGLKIPQSGLVEITERKFILKDAPMPDDEIEVIIRVNHGEIVPADTMQNPTAVVKDVTKEPLAPIVSHLRTSSVA